MANAQELAVREKKELVSKEEKTIPGRYFVPYADIFETEDAMMVVMEGPGGGEGQSRHRAGRRRAAHRRADRMSAGTPGWSRSTPNTTWGTIHARSACPTRSTSRGISAQLDDGVLTLTLPKAKEAQPRRIAIG